MRAHEVRPPAIAEQARQQGVRELRLGQVDAGLALVHVVYLVAMAAVGCWWSVRRLTRRLIV